jgi:hypothetical protein
MSIASVINQKIDLLPFGRKRADSPVNCLPFADIKGKGMHLYSLFHGLFQLLKSFFPSAAEDEVDAVPGEKYRRSSADTGGSSRNESRFRHKIAGQSF